MLVAAPEFTHTHVYTRAPTPPPATDRGTVQTRGPWETVGASLVCSASRWASAKNGGWDETSLSDVASTWGSAGTSQPPPPVEPFAPQSSQVSQCSLQLSLSWAADTGPWEVK